jgi:hypothetical protein
MTFEISDHNLTKECDSIAANIFVDVVAALRPGESPSDYQDGMRDTAHESVDGHNWVIYTHKAVMICAHCDVSAGEEFLDDVGMPDEVTFGKLAEVIAFGEMRHRVESEIERLCEEWDDENPDGLPDPEEEEEEEPAA